MNISTVNELIQSLESAGELSIKERKYLDVMRWAICVAGERDAALNAERVWERAMMEVCGEDGPASVANEIRSLRALRDTALTELMAQVEQLAAENVALKAAFHPSDIPSEWTDVFGDTAVIEHDAAGDNQGHSISWSWVDNQEEVIKSVLLAVDKGIKTPATDRIVAGIKADGVEEFAKKLRTLGSDEFFDAIAAAAADVADAYAYELREGADK
ncbi:hypothetical protein [Klebsiella michiganensis]